MSDRAAEATPPPYLSTLTGVREVALAGVANLAYWRDQLQPARLVPWDDGGRASVLLTAIDARFRGISFRELSIAVRVGDGRDAYLAHAFNSSRLLALAERVFFQTPYHLAAPVVDERAPAGFSVSAGGQTLFSARQRANVGPAPPASVEWQGAIYLPGGDKVFYAWLGGPAVVYPWAAGDQMTITPPAGDNIFRQLVESNFEGREWLARPAAIHARSRTYRRESPPIKS
jgi:hypothetical protein